MKYKKDSKEIEERQITPIVKNNDRYSQNDREGIDNIDARFLFVYTRIDKFTCQISDIWKKVNELMEKKE